MDIRTKKINLIYLLQSYSNNNIQKAIKKTKIYFMDTGLACYLTGYLNAETLEKNAYNGAIFETYIITEIIRAFGKPKMLIPIKQSVPKINASVS